jgi:hypothetical protein
MGNQRSAEGLQISLEKKPIPNLAHTPMARLVEMINRAMVPDSSARAPTLAAPISNEAPGIRTFVENEADHVRPTLRPTPKKEAQILYPKLAGDAHGSTHADAPKDM